MRTDTLESSVRLKKLDELPLEPARAHAYKIRIFNRSN